MSCSGRTEVVVAYRYGRQRLSLRRATLARPGVSKLHIPVRSTSHGPAFGWAAEHRTLIGVSYDVKWCADYKSSVDLIVGPVEGSRFHSTRCRCYRDIVLVSDTAIPYLPDTLNFPKSYYSIRVICAGAQGRQSLYGILP